MENEIQTTNDINNKVNKVPFSYLFISLDIVCRLILLWLFKVEICDIWIFWLTQLFFIPLAILIFTSVLGEKRKKSHLKEKGFTAKDKLEVEGNAKSVIFCLSILVIGTYICFELFSSLSQWLQILFTILTFFTYGFYIMVSFGLSYSKIEKEIKSKKENNNKNNEDLSIELHDERLIELEISLTQFSNKVDTYTLESALIGALSFSGFLAILSLDNAVVNNIQILLAQFSTFFNNLIAFNINVSTLTNLTQQTIMALLAFELIMCSFFFLLVLVSRIRFHDTLCEAELYIKMARELKNKEEEYNIIYLENPLYVIKERLVILTSEIKQKLNMGSQIMKELESIIKYMNYVRNIGLFLFVIILSTSANLVTYKLSISFIVLYIMSYAYHKIDTLAYNHSWKNEFINKRFKRLFGKFH